MNLPQSFHSDLPFGPARFMALARHNHAVRAWARTEGGYKGLLNFYCQNSSYIQARYTASLAWQSIKHAPANEPAFELIDGSVYGFAMIDCFCPMFGAERSLEGAVIAQNMFGRTK